MAVNNPGPEVHITAGLGGPMLVTLRIPTYASLFTAIRELGVSTIGATFIEGTKEALGLRRPQFRAFNTGDGWLVENMHQQWRQIAHASSQCDEMQLMDVAARVASGLSYSEMRLQDLAEAYSVQLRSCTHGNAIQEYRRFKDTNNPAVYKAIHALFWEMAVLRDTLAEFAAAFCFARGGVTTLSGLIRSLRKAPSTDDLARVFLEAADDTTNGWLSVFTSYRNLFTHSAPMEQAAGVAFAVQDTRVISTKQSIPQIYYPLPSNVSELARRRSSGSLFKTFKELVDASLEVQHARHSEPDALDYLCGCLDQLGLLSALLVDRSPIKPKPIEINSKDIIGGIQITPMQ